MSTQTWKLNLVAVIIGSVVGMVVGEGGEWLLFRLIPLGALSVTVLEYLLFVPVIVAGLFAGYLTGVFTRGSALNGLIVGLAIALPKLLLAFSILFSPEADIQLALNPLLVGIMLVFVTVLSSQFGAVIGSPGH